MINFTIISREKKFVNIKLDAGIILASIPLGIALAFFTGGISLFVCSFALGGSLSAIFTKILDPKKRYEFINNNSIIFQTIQKKLTEKIKNQLDKNIIKEKIIIFTMNKILKKKLKK